MKSAPMALLRSFIAGRRVPADNLNALFDASAIAKANGLGGYLYQLIKDVDSVPLEIIYDLKKDYLTNAGTAILVEQVYKEVEDVLENAGVNLMPFKGIVFRYLLYNDPAVRPAVDIDLLIRPEKYEIAHRALLNNGYNWIVSDQNRPISSTKCFERMYIHSAHNEVGNLVDLHSRFSQMNRYTLDYDGLWKRAVSPQALTRFSDRDAPNELPFGSKVVVMSPEDALVHQFIHNSMHLFNIPIRSMVDTKLIIERWQPNWDIVIKLSHDAGVSGGAYLTLTGCKVTLGTEIPDDVLDSLRPSFLKRKWLEIFVSSEPVEHYRISNPSWSFSRCEISKEFEKAAIGLALIDGWSRGFLFSISYLRIRIADLVASMKGQL